MKKIITSRLNILLNSAVNATCREFRIPLMVLEPAQYHLSLGYLAEIDAFQKKPRIDFAEAPGELVLFTGFDQGEMSEFLRVLRKKTNASLPYKAMLTPTNAFWSPAALFVELKAEHARMNP